MTLSPGSRLGIYEIVELIGAGGMGEVYRARDTRLKREVAVKVLPDEFASDPDRLARFQREAELLATLNHPNIGGVYGFEQSHAASAIILELIDGETLADRITRGPLPVKAALAIALQIAEALEAAHERGVIHRDLKPANIKVTPDGKVKVLDFGLAKAMEANAAGRMPGGLSHSPTLSMMATQAGVILGTAAYMSPEQAKGLPADQRSDVFAFGTVLYEMLTGRQPFRGDTAPDVLASVIVRDVDLNALPPNLNPRLKELLERCLEKSPKKRWQAIGDVRADLERIALAGPDAPAGVTIGRRLWNNAALAAVAAIAGATFAFVALGRMTPAAPHLQVSRFSVTLPDVYDLANALRHVVEVSPDGTHIVFVANRQLYIRAVNEYAARPIPGSESQLGLSNPVFSPDGRSIAFYASGAVRRITVTGGTAAVVCQAEAPHGMSWTGDSIVFGQGTKGIFRVRADSKPELIVPAKSGEVLHAGEILPDGQSILFTVALEGAADRWNTALVAVQNVATGSRKTLIEGGSDARYLDTGHLLYALGSTVLAVPFDVRRLELAGTPTAVVQDVQRSAASLGTAHFDVSRTGTLVYLSGQQNFQPKGSFVYRSRDGRHIQPITGESENFPRYPRVSPDGRWMAVTVGPNQQGNIWIYDLRGGRQPQKLTNEAHNILPVWSRDGSRIYFFSGRVGGGGIWSVAADGSETPKPLRLSFDRGGAGRVGPQDFSSDGLLMVSPGGVEDRRLFLTAVTDNATPTPWIGSEHFEDEARFSPDGKFVAYASDSTGDVEIWVRPYPGPGAPVRVSRNGGHDPVWSKSGAELFYQSGPRMMSVKIIATAPEFRASAPAELFSGGFLQWGPTLPRTYDVAADGRFLMVQTTTEQRGGNREMRVVLNWFEELSQRVPTGAR